MPRITSVYAREVLDSRGRPTVEVDVKTDVSQGRALVPAGASTGRFEAVEVRDQESRYRGFGVRQAVAHVNTVIASALLGADVLQQASLDAQLCELDGTPNKARLGANAILGVSLAIAHAAAAARNMPLYQALGAGTLLPMPLINIINGGAHANNGLDVQEFMIVPLVARSFSEALEIAAEIFYALKHYLAEHHISTAVGDEGGFAPPLRTNEEAIELILTVLATVGFKPTEIGLALDFASSEYYHQQHYHFNQQILTQEDYLSLLQTWVRDYSLYSLEDALAEEDWQGWHKLTKMLGSQVQLVGDDLFVTHPDRLAQGMAQQVANAILIKPNQIGTLTETLTTIARAQDAAYTTIISHRSGETEDTTIADLAVAVNAGQIKTGSLCRSERISKYNQLLRIEEALGTKARFPNKDM